MTDDGFTFELKIAIGRFLWWIVRPGTGHPPIAPTTYRLFRLPTDNGPATIRCTTDEPRTSHGRKVLYIMQYIMSCINSYLASLKSHIIHHAMHHLHITFTQTHCVHLSSLRPYFNNYCVLIKTLFVVYTGFIYRNFIPISPLRSNFISVSLYNPIIALTCR